MVSASKVNSKELARFMRFAVVGAIGAVIDFSVFNLFTNLTPISPIAASVVSFCLAVVSNFLLNRFWTYPDSRSKAIHTQVIQFVIISVIGLIIRTPLFALLEKVYTQWAQNLIPNFPIGPVSVGHNLALATAIVVVMIWNFIANRFWTYNDVN